MLKNLLCGAAVLALSDHAALASGVIVNGVPHHGAGPLNISYGGVEPCCVEDLPYTPLPVISGHSAPAPVIYEAPVTYETMPAVTYEPAPVITHQAAPAVTYISDPVVTHQAVPAVSSHEFIVHQPPAPAPIVAAPVYAAPAVAVPAVKAKKPRGAWSSRVYVGARGGWTGTRDTGFNIATGGVRNSYENRGYNVAAVVGWGAKIKKSIGYRLEAELGYQTADVDSHRVGGTTFGSAAEGDTSTLYGFANAYLDVPLFSRLNGIIGGGAGIGRVEFDGHGIDLAGVGTVVDDADTVFGYHLDAGLSYDVTDRLALEAMYRYTQFVDVELKAEDGTRSDDDVSSHNVLVGARYGF